ncbi:energy transducer TonB [Sphingomicrobium arenosum]|uniref:energy transducer TonB n=1 Tax=Sphingomicrobium arenosum TaxID=2233861 RepID=UPI00223ED72C|nr:energy transducer TonB [Sphingomicrobium arenosum]
MSLSILPIGLALVASDPAQPGESAARGDVRSLFRAEDYPADALRLDQEGAVRARLAITPQGTVSECVIVETSGSPALDRATCDILMERATFDPAVNNQGRLVEASYTTPLIHWRIHRQSVRAQSYAAAADGVDPPLIFGFSSEGKPRRCEQLIFGADGISAQPCTSIQKTGALVIGMLIVTDPLYADRDWLVGTAAGSRQDVGRWKQWLLATASEARIARHLAPRFESAAPCPDRAEELAFCGEPLPADPEKGSAPDKQERIEFFLALPTGTSIAFEEETTGD